MLEFDTIVFKNIQPDQKFCMVILILILVIAHLLMYSLIPQIKGDALDGHFYEKSPSWDWLSCSNKLTKLSQNHYTGVVISTKFSNKRIQSKGGYRFFRLWNYQFIWPQKNPFSVTSRPLNELSYMMEVILTGAYGNKVGLLKYCFLQWLCFPTFLSLLLS